MSYFAIGQRVYTGPQPFAPAGTKETPNPVAPPRPTGTVRGIQDLEPPVSYLIAKDGVDAGTEWISADNLEAVPEDRAADAA